MSRPARSPVRARHVASLLLAACWGCGGVVHPQTAPPPPLSGSLGETRDPRVGVYVSSPHGFSTSSYWIEGPDGVIVIDTQFLPSAAAELIGAVEAKTGKPIKLAIVLHPNPDKFNGVATFQAHGVDVVTSSQVRAHIGPVHAQRHARFYADHKPDYPNTAPEPRAFGDQTTTLTAGGVEVVAHVLDGPGCSPAHVAVSFEGNLFVGDLVANGHHAWLEIGEAPAWIGLLEGLAALQPSQVHPGRGPSGPAKLLTAQIAYLRFVIDRMTAQRAAQPTGRAAIEATIADVKAQYPNAGNPYFLEIGVPAEWRRQAGR